MAISLRQAVLALLATAGLSLPAVAQSYNSQANDAPAQSYDDQTGEMALAPPAGEDESAVDESVANDPLVVEPVALDQSESLPAADDMADESADDMPAANGESGTRTAPHSPSDQPLPNPTRAGSSSGNRRRAATNDADERAPIYNPGQPHAGGGSPIYPEEVAGGSECDYDELSFSQLLSSGTWLHCGRWFAQTEVTLLHRSTAPRQILTDIPLVFQNTVFFSDAMTTESAGFGYEPGMRVTVGKYLGRDDDNRDRTLEFSYMGLNDYTSQHAVVANLIPANNSNLAAVLFRNPLDRGIGAFNYSTRQAYAYESDFHSFEVNAKLSRRLGRDQLVLQPNGEWTRECTPGLLPTFLAGFRTMMIDEDFTFEAQRDRVFTGITNYPNGANPLTLQVADGLYAIETSNRLLGVQVGAELIEQRCNWSFGVRSKIGGYCNFAEQNTTVRINDNPTNFTIQNRDEHATDEQLTLAIELGLVGTYQLRPNVALRAAYDFMWLQGLALAPEQLDFNAGPIPNVRTGAHHFYDGMSLGIEWVW